MVCCNRFVGRFARKALWPLALRIFAFVCSDVNVHLLCPAGIFANALLSDSGSTVRLVQRLDAVGLFCASWANVVHALQRQGEDVHLKRLRLPFGSEGGLSTSLFMLRALQRWRRPSARRVCACSPWMLGSYGVCRLVLESIPKIAFSGGEQGCSSDAGGLRTYCSALKSVA